MRRIALTDVRKSFGDVLNLVANARERILIREGKTDRAALISLEDLALLESLDDGRDVPVEHVSLDEVRKHLKKDVGEVANRLERIVVQDAGNDLVALVPERDLALLEHLDTRIGLEAAKRLLDKRMRDQAR